MGISVALEQYDKKWWRLNNLYKIRTKERGIVTFRPNSIQKTILREVAGMKPIRHFALKSRQVGLSTLWLLYWLDDTIFRPATITGILAHKWESLTQLMSILKIGLSNFPQSQLPFEVDSKSRLSFKNNSTIFISLEIRSTTLHNLHISEWCFCENDRIWATQGAISKYTNVTGESTGNGMGNDGYSTYMDAKEGKNGYRSLFIPWYAHEEYQMTMPGQETYFPDKRERDFNLTQAQIHFRRQMMSTLKSQFSIEYPETEEDAFAQSGAMFFDNRKIIMLAKEARQLENETPRIEQSDKFIIWEMPQKYHKYVIGADVAEGVDGDYSAFKVLCLTCRQESMAYRSHVGMDVYYRDLDTWGRRYNNALLGVERNNHGHAVLLGLVENCQYPNLFKEEETQTRVLTDLTKSKPPKWGWGTTAQTKPMMLDHLKFAVEGDGAEDENTFLPEYTIRDLTFLSECLTFQRDGVKLNAVEGKFDDTVIASAIAYQMYLREKGKLNRTSEKGILIGDSLKAANLL